MKEKFPEETNKMDEWLSQIVDGVEPNAQFTAELEQSLINAHHETSSSARFHFTRKQTIATLAWAVSLIAFALFMSWTIRLVAPTPTEIPASNQTSAPPSTDAPNNNNETQVTPAPQGGYDWRGTKLYLNAPLPDSPSQANIYQLKENAPATAEQAQALAQQFGIQGEVYASQNLGTGSTELFITDGKQSLFVNTSQFFVYTADMAKAVNFRGRSDHPNAEAVINEFLASRGFDFPHRISKGDLFGGYQVEPLSPDGFPMRYDFFSPSPMQVTLDENGQVLQVQADLMSYETVGAQPYGIISAEEAFQKMRDDSVPVGKIEGGISAIFEAKQWIREYPTNETIAIYGYSSSYPALDPSQPAFNQIDGFTVTGNTGGMDALERNTFVEATGQFVVENGVKKFNVESWQIAKDIQDGLTGTLTSENGQVVLLTDGGERLTIEPELPADVPLPFENAFVVGVRKEDKYIWTLIDDRMSVAMGGGGGGGPGFYELNLSGTPVPFPPASPTPGFGDGNYTVQAGDTFASIADAHGITTDELMQANGMTDTLIFVGQQLIIPTQPISNETLPPIEYTVKANDTCGSIASHFSVSVQSIIDLNNLSSDCFISIGTTLLLQNNGQSQNPDIGRRFENQRGLINVSIVRKLNGSLVNEYTFATNADGESYYLRLTGDNLEGLAQAHNRPVNLWATIESRDELGIYTARVDRYEIPYPDLQFQILRGKQQNVVLEGQSATLFTTNDGVRYVQIMQDGTLFNPIPSNDENDEVLLEALIIPDESFGGYPSVRVFNSMLAISPKDGKPEELPITADQPYTYDESPASSESYVPPALTIEKVELIYYVTNPHMQTDRLDGSPLYIQPAWRFYGHYENGDVFEVIVQALKQEFLLPDPAPYVQGG